MHTPLLTLTLVAAVVATGDAQSPALQQEVSLSIVADSVKRRPLHGFDGVMRGGPAENILTAIGNVVVRINDVESKADTAVWQTGTTKIDLIRGGVHTFLDMAAVPTAWGFQVRKPVAESIHRRP